MDTEQKIEDFLAAAKTAEMRAAKADNSAMRESWLKVASGYRDLARASGYRD